MVSETEAAYMAGILDGEGTIHLRYRPGDLSFPEGDRRRWRSWACRIGVNNTSAELIAWINERFPGHVVAYGVKNPKHKPMHEWRVLGSKARPVLEASLPYLVVKQRQAEIALEFIETIGGNTGRSGCRPEILERRIALEAELTELNRRGMSQAA